MTERWDVETEYQLWVEAQYEEQGEEIKMKKGIKVVTEHSGPIVYTNAVNASIDAMGTLNIYEANDAEATTFSKDSITKIAEYAAGAYLLWRFIGTADADETV